MKNFKYIRRPNCTDVIIFCQKCGKTVREGLFNTEDYFRCDLNHIFCVECKERYGEDCPICKLPLEYEELKTLF